MDNRFTIFPTDNLQVFTVKYEQPINLIFPDEGKLLKDMHNMAYDRVLRYDHLRFYLLDGHRAAVKSLLLSANAQNIMVDYCPVVSSGYDDYLLTYREIINHLVIVYP